MELTDLITKFSDTPKNQQKAIFNSIFIIGNKLQTIFDNQILEVSLKQFMLLSTIRHSKDNLTFTKLGQLLGCSRQNIKKLASVLEKKGFVTIQPSPSDPRASCICPTAKVNEFFNNEFFKYQEDLKYLFEVYTNEEINTLFNLLMKLYPGINNLEKHLKGETHE